jgi:hypothetical protein
MPPKKSSQRATNDGSGNTARDDGVFDTGEIYDAVTIPDYIAISVLIVLILMAAARLFARGKP